MAPTKKLKQNTLSRLFKWNVPPHTNSNQAPLVNVEREIDFDLNDDLHEDIELHGMETLDVSTIEKSSRNPSKEGPKLRKFRPAWGGNNPWIRYLIKDGKELMKCMYCEKYKMNGPWGIGDGCVTMQHDAILDHVLSNNHKLALAKWLCEVEKKAKPIEMHVEEIVDANKARVITTMKLMYFIAQRDLSIATYEELCELAMELKVPNMPKSREYSSYTSRASGYQFLYAFAIYLLEVQKQCMNNTPYYSIMLDESTDRGLELHMIVYVTYLTCKGVGPMKSQYLGLLKIDNGKGRTIYHAMKEFLLARGICDKKIVGVATDGASAMTGSEIGFVTLLKKDLPSLIAVHCIAHREALAVSDVAKNFPELLFVEKLANKVYSWMNNSSKRNNELMELLSLMKIDAHRVLQIHGIRWLSRGQVMQRLVELMPGVLSLWKQEKFTQWYNKARIFSVQFCLHMLADVLGILNDLSLEMQKEHVDLTCIGSAIDVAINKLKRSYLREGCFVQDTIFLSKFLASSSNGYLEINDKDGVMYCHDLCFQVIPKAKKNDDDEVEDVSTMRPCIDGSLESCKSLAKVYVQALVDNLNARFHDLPLFNAAKLFSPCHYADDELTREGNAKRWLEKLLHHLQPNKDNALLHVDNDACFRELYAFIDTLRLNCNGFSMKEAWRMFGHMKNWQDSFPNLMKLWQVVLVLPASTVACERGFSKQNLIKDDMRTRLTIKTLDDLMRVSLTGPKTEEVEWDRVFDIWKGAKERRIYDV
ncbi:hypothetical protein L7F22_051941 [Adiantum nelumboides]|nr:hypothetical protein [Adiantum nelumboides]